MRIRIALTAFFCMALACAVFAQSRTGQGASGNSRGGLLSSAGSSSGKTTAKQSGGRGIFDIATSSDTGKKQGGTVAPAVGRTTATVSPFGTTSPRTRSSSARRWKTASKIAECIRAKAIPSNTNLTFSGTITDIVTDGRYVILTMFDSVETTAENGAKGDVPVTYTVVLDAESVAGDKNIKEGGKKSFTVDSNYAYLVWNDSGCTVRAVDNALTEPDPAPASGTKKR
jgi:hypothetical protein